MKVFIITNSDPIKTIPFLKQVIKARKGWVTGVAITDGNRLTINKKRSVVIYLLSLLLIMGPVHFIKNSMISIQYKLFKTCSNYISFLKNSTFEGWLEKEKIPFKRIKSPNNNSFLAYLESQGIDLIINQSSAILKKELLDLPKIGIINRHNALLPKNRGRLTPFWVLYKGEEETAVSIHFVTEALDAGDIIVQKKIQVEKTDSFNDLVKKNYDVAPVAMIEALDKLHSGSDNYLPNKDEEATYNSTPTFRDALRFRLKRLGIDK